MINVVIDCFGGDLGVKATVPGGLDAIKKFGDLNVFFTGKKEEIEKEIEKISLTGKQKSRVFIEDAPNVVDMNEAPTVAIRRTDTSLAAAIAKVKEEGVDGVISLGSTGAVLTGAVLKIGRIRGVMRPACCPVLPTMNKGLVGVCDSGANAECKPEYLRQFAVMGSRYMECCYGVKNPRVALLNIGTEEEKGDELHKEAYALLKNTDGINFVGNMESRDLLSGKYDLVVCDGFSGNVLLKSTEGACLEMLKMLKREMTSSLKNKIGALFLKKSIMKQKEYMDYRNYGGAVLLGTKKLVVKCHGNGDEKSVYKCVEQIYLMAKNGVNERIASSLPHFE